MTQIELQEQIDKYLKEETHPQFRSEVKDLQEQKDWKELEERFYTSLSFGTGGLRGLIGGGTNRINPLTIRKATLGLANYIKNQTSANPSAVIAHDSRNYSDLFALEAALVLAGKGIKTYLFSSLRPTPELSFAVRELSASAGIVITASHNPAAYNGYKVYWADGGQIVPPHDKGIIEEVRKVDTIEGSITQKEAESRGLLVWIDKEIDEKYIAQLKSLSIRPDLIQKYGKDIKIAYTPLHGTGVTILPDLFEDLGIDMELVAKQAKPDGDFPTVPYPNPEEESAMEMAIELAKQIKADLAFGTDPDSDRLGAAVPLGNGEYTILSGNQLGALLEDYIFHSLLEKKQMPQNPAFVNTIVTSDLQRRIAEKYGVKHFQTLTGFKYIGEKIQQFEMDQSYQFVFGGEESYGYLVGTAVRDKDAVVSAFMTAEMTLYYKSKGMTLLDRLEEIWHDHGYYEEILLTHTFQGKEGLAQREQIMKDLRTNGIKTLGGIEVQKIKDYLTGETMENGSAQKNIDLPTSNVLQFILIDGSVVTARPSGTEPKIKFYASCRSEQAPLSKAKREANEKINAIKKDLQELMPK